MKTTKVLVYILLLSPVLVAQQPISQVASQSTSATMQSAAVANGNGTSLNTAGMSSAVLTVNCSSCSGGTTVNFEATEDGSNYMPLTGVQVGSSTIATTTTTSGITYWQFQVANTQNVRARISGYSAGTITVTGHSSPMAWNDNGSQASTNSGNKDNGTLRVVVATDQPNLNSPLNVTDSCTAANCAMNVAQINGVTPLMGNGTTGTGSPRVTPSSDSSAIANWGHGATGAAVPSGATQIGGNGSGNLTTPLNCDGYAFYDAATNGATQLVGLVSGKTIYVCGYSFTSSSTTANTLKLVYGTGSNCATGQTAMTPGLVLQVAASTGPAGKVIPVSGWSRGLKTAASNALCVLTNAAANAQAEVWFTQF